MFSFIFLSVIWDSFQCFGSYWLFPGFLIFFLLGLELYFDYTTDNEIDTEINNIFILIINPNI